MRKVLFIDMDERIDEWSREDEVDWLACWRKAVEAVLSAFNLKAERIVLRESPSGRGLHAWIHLDREIPDMQANMLEWLCGGDLTRSRINRFRIKRGVKHWDKLFSKHLWRKPVDEKCRRCILYKLHQLLYPNLPKITYSIRQMKPPIRNEPHYI